MSRRQPTKLTREDHLKLQLDRCTRVLQKLEAHSYRSPTSSPRRPPHLLKSHTMTSFDAYVNHSADVSKTKLSSPSLGSFHYGNKHGNHGNNRNPFDNHVNSISNHGNQHGNQVKTFGNHGNQGMPEWSLSSAANFLGKANGWYSKQPNNTRKSQPSMDTDELCEFLSRKGLGDPREAMRHNRDRRSQEHEDRRQVVKLAERRQRDKCQVTYYLQKLRAQSFLDSAAANSRAEAFCEQQGVRPLRSASAGYRTNAETNVEVNGVFSASGSDASSRTGSDVMNTKTDTRYHQDLYERISAWLEDCEGATWKEDPTRTGTGDKGEEGGKRQTRTGTGDKGLSEEGVRRQTRTPAGDKGPTEEGMRKQTTNELKRAANDRNKRDAVKKCEEDQTRTSTGDKGSEGVRRQTVNELKRAANDMNKRNTVEKIEPAGGMAERSLCNVLPSGGKPIKSSMSSKTKSTNINKAARKVVLFLPNV